MSKIVVLVMLTIVLLPLKAYGDEEVTPIAEQMLSEFLPTWDVEVLKKHFDPAELEHVPPQAMQEFMSTLSKELGPLEARDRLKCKSGIPPSVSGSEQMEAKCWAQANFEKGFGTVILNLIKRGVEWRIVGIFVNPGKLDKGETRPKLVEEVKAEAFREIQHTIDVSSYPARDPHFEENQKALRNGREVVKDRFITLTGEDPVGYVVSNFNAKGRARITMFYTDIGELLYVRLFSSPDYPRTAYIYCASRCEDDRSEKVYGPGELMSVSFHVSDRDVFYFDPQGNLSSHIKD